MTTTPSPDYGTPFSLHAVVAAGELYQIEASDMSHRHVVIVRECRDGVFEVAHVNGVTVHRVMNTHVTSKGEIKTWT